MGGNVSGEMSKAGFPTPETEHFVLKNKLMEVPEGFQKAYIANGCFWGSERRMWRIPGVYSTAVMYINGHGKQPSYEEVCTGRSGYVEGLQVVWDPEKCTYVDLLRMFLESHDPTQMNGQGNDHGTQYRGGVYFTDENQKILAEAAVAAYEKVLGKKLATEVVPLKNAFCAEEYHQQYLARPGSRPYCSAQPHGKPLPHDWFVGVEVENPENYMNEDAILPKKFWEKHGPTPFCSITKEPDEQIDLASL